MPQDWNGLPNPDASGNIAVDGFNDFLQDHPNLRKSPVRAAIKFVELDDPGALKTQIRAETNQLESPERVRVVLIEDGIADDSIRAVRFALEFRRVGESNWKVQSAKRTQKCQPGRGHQGFSPAPCI